MSHRTRAAIAVTGLALALVPAAGSAAASAATPTKKPELKVMTRNLYLGADIITIATAKNLADEEAKAAALKATVDANDWPARGKEIAKEIATVKPDVVALNEVTRYTRGPDGVHNGKGGETQVLYDYIPTLQKELKVLHQSYRVASQQTEIDVTVPSAAGYDLRLQLGNATLVRTGKGARVSHVKGLSGTFKAPQLSVTLPDQTIKVSRGYAGLDGTVGGQRFRLLAPHAEAYGEQLALGQMQELLKGPGAITKYPVIIAGDLNSDPTVKSGATQTNGNDPSAPAASVANAAYNAIIKAGFTDVSKKVATCCQDGTLDNKASKLSQWIDHILVKPKATTIATGRTGYRPSDKVDGGKLWPSDHAGFWATIRFR